MVEPATPALTIVVRASHLAEADLEVPSDWLWSVRQLKDEIARLAPQRPRPEDQRLVYAGKLLTDDQILGQVLRRHDPELRRFTLHLVWSNPAGLTSLPEAAAEAAAEVGGLRHRGQPAEASAAAPTPTQLQPQSDWSAYFQTHWPGYAPSHAPHPSNPEHAHWWQSMYGEYMNQYMQYIQSHHSHGFPAVSHPNNGTPAAMGGVPVPDYNNYPFWQDMTHPGAPAAPPVEGPNVVPPEGAQGGLEVLNAGPGGALGAMGEEEGDGRDALDVFYLASRVLVLFSIVYFSSSATRLLVVAAFGTLAYLWNVGLLRRQPILPAPGPADGPAAPADQPEEQDGDPADREDGQSDGESEAEEAVPEDGPFQTALTFVTTFFTSLLPEQPQVLV